MFVCQLCDDVVGPGTRSHRLVIQQRVKTYPTRLQANCVRRLKGKGKRKKVYIDDPGGSGAEVARELIVCPQCAQSKGCPSG